MVVSNVRKRSEDLGSVERYLIVGLAVTVFDIGLFMALHTVLGVPELAANTLSYSAGAVNSFLLHRYWTFAGRPRKAFVGQLSQFMLIWLGGLLASNLLFLALEGPLTSLFASEYLGDLLGKGAATGAAMCWTFAANHMWTF